VSPDDAAPPDPRVARLELRLERERLRRREAERLGEVGTRRLFELARDLDQLVSLRTQDANDARKEAEKALSSRVELLRMIAHEVLTPMHQIQGMLELVDMSRLPEVDRDRVVASSDSAAAVAHLVRDVADLVASETDTLEVSMSECRPADHLRVLTQHWRPVAARRGVLLVLEAGIGDELEIVTDPLRVRRVMDELLLAAVGAAKTRVVVRSRADPSTTARESQRLVIEVHDDGSGDPEQPWTMADLLGGEVNADVSAETVVGLLLAQRLVAALGGWSDLGTSDLGGAVRTVALPVDQSDSR